MDDWDKANDERKRGDPEAVDRARLEGNEADRIDRVIKLDPFSCFTNGWRHDSRRLHHLLSFTVPLAAQLQLNPA